MKAVLDGLRALGPGRQIALAVVGLAMFVMLGLLAAHGGAPAEQALLYGDLDLREAAQIADALDRAHIAHRELGSGDRITVAGNDVARARLLLAKDGLPSGGSVGYEIFDRGDAMTSTQFQQDINETRALEGELSRSIRLLQGVRGARVHLVLPKRQPFSRDVQAAGASVLLTMSGAARLDPGAVQAILNLVSAAVPGLKPQGIAVIDSRGALLARAGQPTGQDAIVQTGEEVRRATELRLSRAVEDMLEQSVGPGRVRAEAAVQMSFDRINETAESYNPDQQVVRSTQTTTDKSNSTEADRPVTTQNNLPNADAGQGQAGSQQQKQEETTNYEIGKTVRTLVREQPQIARISLAIMVDGSLVTGRDGRPVWTERSAEDLSRIKTLAQTAIGYDEKRGDKVEVVSMRFAHEDVAGTEASTGLLGLGLERADMVRLSQSVVLAVVVLLALLAVLRPMAIRLSSPAMPLLGGDRAGQAVSPVTVLTSSPLLKLAGPGGTNAPEAANLLVDDSMVTVASVEGQLRASSLRRLSDLVGRHPEESLAIMRGWMAEASG